MNAVSNDGGAVLSVLPNLPNKSVVIIDNAKYHSRKTGGSKASTTAWRVGQIRDWLTSKGKPIWLGKSREILYIYWERHCLDSITCRTFGIKCYRAYLGLDENRGA